MLQNIADLMVTMQLADRLSKPVKGICNTLGSMTKQISEVSRSCDTLSGKMKKIGNEFTVAGRTLMGEAFADFGMLEKVGNFVLKPTMEYADFEQGMARVKALVEDTSMHDALEQQARQLGRDTQFTNLQAAQSQENLVRANFSAMETLNTMPHLLNMAAVEGMDLAEASSIMAGAMRGFGIDASESQRVVDVLAQGSAIAKTNIAGLGNAMEYAAPAARTLGITIEEATAMIGIMADNSIDASKAGTALSMGLSQLANKQDKLARFGIHIADVSGNMLPILDVLKQMDAVTSKMGNLEQQAFFSDIFGVEAARGMSLVIRGTKEGANGLSAFTEKLQKLEGASDAFGGIGFAAKKAAEVNDTIRGSLTRLGSALGEFNTSIGEAFKSDFRGFIDSLTVLIARTTEFVNNNPGFVNAIQKVVSAFMLLKVGQIGIKVASSLMLQPLGGMLSLFGKLGATRLGAGLKYAAENFKILRGAGFSVIDALRGCTATGSVVTKHIWALAGSFKRGIIAVKDFGVSLAQAAAQHITAFAGKIRDGIAAIASFAAQLAKQAAHALAQFATSIAHGIAHMATFAWTMLVKGVTAAVSFAASLIGAGVSALTAFGSAVWASVTACWSFTAALLANPITWVVIGIVALIAALAALVYYWDDVKAAVIGFVSAASEWLGGLWENIVGICGNLFDIITSPFRSAIDTVKGWWDGFWNWLGFGKAEVGVEMTTSNSKSPAEHAIGGRFSQPHLGWLAEAGPEWYIPEDGSMRSRQLVIGAAAANGMLTRERGREATKTRDERPIIISGPVNVSVPNVTSPEQFVEMLGRGLRRFVDTRAEALA